ncbi:MAG: cyclopropane-fatty-acyl-phospholipid synthase family protein, partial [Planctomycetales bacterium]
QNTTPNKPHPQHHQHDPQETKNQNKTPNLRNKAAERKVDNGCGWGGLLIHAARNYGVEAVGVTLSGEQADSAKQAIEDAGLADRIQIELTDYREFHQPGRFDKASSVGMSEHIGIRKLPTFLGKIYECLKPGGAYLHHSITLRPGDPWPVWVDFCLKYVFPNGQLQSIVQTVDSAAKVGFEVRDVESLREHYALTLQHWVRRLDANREAILNWTDEVGFRIFQIYLCGAISAFRSGECNLHQFLLVRPDHSRPEQYLAGLPLTRSDWYT